MAAENKEVIIGPTNQQLQDAITEDSKNVSDIITNIKDSEVLKLFYSIEPQLSTVESDIDPIKDVLNKIEGCEIIDQLGVESLAGSLFILKTCVIAGNDMEDAEHMFHYELIGLTKELSKNKLERRLSLSTSIPEFVLRSRRQTTDTNEEEKISRMEVSVKV